MRSERERERAAQRALANSRSDRVHFEAANIKRPAKIDAIEQMNGSAADILHRLRLKRAIEEEAERQLCCSLQKRRTFARKAP